MLLTRIRPLGWLVIACFAASIALAQQQARPRKYAEQEVLVRFRSTALTAPDTFRDYDLSSTRRIGGVPGLYHLRSRSRDTATLLRMLAKRGDVLYAEPNLTVQALGVPNDPQVPQMWGLQNTGQDGGTPGADIHVVPAWDISTGNPLNAVGIVDTGFDYTHPDLQANLWSAPTDFSFNIGGMAIHCPAGSHGFNAIRWNCDPMDDHKHGTHVAGTIGAVGNNALGVVGVNWSTQMIALKFLDSSGSGYLADAINAIEFAIQLKTVLGVNVRILSNSWGGGGFTQSLLDEINRAGQNDMLFVAAAGNNAANNDVNPMYPASYAADNIVAVAATDNADALAYFSNWGPTTVDLGAPGVNILSTVLQGGYGYLSGTSMATPHVSGTAGLVLSTCALDTPTLKQLLLSTVDPVPALAGKTLTGGRLNANTAIRACSGTVSLIPGSIAFGSVTLGKTSPPRQLTLTNNQDIPVIITSITVTPGDFSLQTNCGSSLSSKQSCMIQVTFAPLSGGDKTGTVQVTDDAAGSPRLAVLSGRGSNDADLAMTAVGTPTAAAYPGATVEITATVASQGNLTAPASVTGYYLSSSGQRDGSAKLLGTAPLPALPPGQSYSSDMTLPTPADIASGRYYAVACADDSNVIAEPDEKNNCAASSTTILVQLPDLTEGSVSTTTTASGVGKSFQVTDTVSNLAAVPAGASTTQYYLSLYPVRTASAYLLAGQRAIPPLAGGAASNGNATVTIPSGVAPAGYYVLACADDANQIHESNENNNCGATSAKVQVGPDLIENTPTLGSTTAGAGGTVLVTDTTVNGGGGDAGASVVQYYLSSSLGKSNSAQLLTGNRSVPALASGASATGTASVTLPNNTIAGSYYVLACADDTSQVSEVSENNNCAAAATKLQVGPDLIENALTLSSSIGAAGGSLTVTDTTVNQGGGSAGQSIVQYYLSTSMGRTASAQLLGGARSVGPLAPGRTSSGSASITVPATTGVGSYYVLACADDSNQVVEANENNNCISSSTRIQIGPDFAVNTPTLSSVIAGSGGALQVTETTANQGGATAGSSVTQFYLSTFMGRNSSSILLAGARQVPPLVAGGTSTGTTVVTVPVSVAVGGYYLVACADDLMQVIETNENNNCTASSVRIQIGPDLTEGTPTLNTMLTGPGGNVVVGETALNQGGGAAGGFAVRFYLSTFMGKNNSSFLLAGTRLIASLAAGGSSSGMTTIALPTNVAVGSYYLVACADDLTQVVETNENNNCASSAARIQVGPDLIESAPTVASQLSGAGGNLVATEMTSNLGGGAAGDSVVQFYLSTFMGRNASSVLLAGTRTAGPLAAQANSSGTSTLGLPSNMSVGSYYLVACADNLKQVDETNENNNCSASSARVQVGPDLSEIGLSLNANQATPGASLLVTETAINSGGGGAGTSAVRFYLSPFMGKNNSSPLLSGSRAVAAMAPGGNSAGTTAVTLPTNVALGTYYIIACADDTGQVAETNEYNNCASSASIQVVSP